MCLCFSDRAIPRSEDPLQSWCLDQWLLTLVVIKSTHLLFFIVTLLQCKNMKRYELNILRCDEVEYTVRMIGAPSKPVNLKLIWMLLPQYRIFFFLLQCLLHSNETLYDFLLPLHLLLYQSLLMSLSVQGVTSYRDKEQGTVLSLHCSTKGQFLELRCELPVGWLM